MSDDLRARLLVKLDEWLALSEKATPGPWRMDGPVVRPMNGGKAGKGVACIATTTSVSCSQQRIDRGMRDAQMMALSRTAGPAAWRALRGVVEMHAPWGIYDDCGHDHADGDTGTLIFIEDIGTVCEEGRLWTVCRQCHTDDGESRPEHDYSDDDFPCPTLERIAKEILGDD